MAYKKNFVSIIIPHYNYSDYIWQCLDSIFKQKYKKFEVIIVDDFSQEEEYNKMFKIVNEYSQSIKTNIIISRNDKNLGLTLTRNEGVKKSQGEFILFLDPDDNIDEYFLSKTVKTLRENPEIGFAYVNTMYFGAENKTLRNDTTSLCKHVISIPTKYCLNLAMAVTIVLYDRKSKEK